MSAAGAAGAESAGRTASRGDAQPLLWGGLSLLGVGLTVLALAWPGPLVMLSLGLAGLILLIWRPQLVLGLYPTIMLSLPVISRGAEEVATGIRADQLLLLLTLVAAVCYLVANRLPLPVNHLLLLYMLYLLSFLISICFSKFALGAPAGMLDLIQFAGLSRPFFILLIFMLLINSAARAWIVVRAVLFTGIAVLLFGFGQISQNPLATALTLVFYNRKVDLEDWELFRRITATFDGQSNQAAFFGYIYAGLLGGLLLCLPREQLKRYGLPLGGLLFAALLFLLQTGSRAALAGLLLAVGVVVFLQGRRNLIILATSGMLAAFSVALMSSRLLFNRLMEVMAVLGGASAEVVVGYRFTNWRNILQKYFWPSPLLGSGPNLFVADSSYVVELCLRGILGLLLYCALILVVARAAYVTWKHAAHPLGRALGVCVLVSTIGIIVQGFSIVVLAGTRPAELYWLLVATMWFFYPAQKRIRIGGAALNGREPAGSALDLKPVA